MITVMEKNEEMMIERILGRDFLKAAKTYGASMREACARQGASENVQSSMERIATVAFCKGAEYFRSSLWHTLSDGYPALDTFLLCRGEDGHLYIAKVVKTGNGRLAFRDEAGNKCDPPRHWMQLPNVEEVEEPKGKTIPLKK